MSVPSADAEILRDTLCSEGARRVLEIGLAYGSSALAIAEALVLGGSHDVCHVIIDPYQDRFGNQGWDTLDSTGLTDLCCLWRERSQTVLPQLVAGDLVFDAAFVDGSHLFHNVFVDLYFLRELVRPHGLVILDDIAIPSVASAALYFELYCGWTRHPLEGSARLCAYRLPSSPVDPVLGDFSRNRWLSAQ